VGRGPAGDPAGDDQPGERSRDDSAGVDLAEAIPAAIPAAVHELLGTLWAAGHAAYVVGGAVRDVVAGRSSPDWDLATAAPPETTARLLAHALYENRFGTVTVRRGGTEYQVTTFRSDHDYADYRRPHRVEFGASLEADLARRDFTMNALAWGREPGGPVRLVDPFGGVGDIAAHRIRAVGDAPQRFEEDALRIVRAIRFATTLGFTIEPATLAAIHASAPLVRHLSGERIAAELDKILEATRPSVGLQLLAETGVLAGLSPDLAAQVGVPQAKVPGEDLWDHTVRTVDAAATAGASPIVRWAAFVHDIGKPATAADGHFYRHESVGADLAAEFLERLRVSNVARDRIVHLVRQHMFRYEPAWGDPAIRRFLGKIGPSAIDDLFALRAADNIGSGLAPNVDDLDELRSRVAAEMASGPILDRSALAVDGSDLIQELGLEPGPEVGRVLAALFDRVVDDPGLNARASLLELARALAPERAGSTGRTDRPDPADRADRRE
jgi:tRNA nucleotidyltransferase (CCA-adding enzyme)